MSATFSPQLLDELRDARSARKSLPSSPNLLASASLSAKPLPQPVNSAQMKRFKCNFKDVRLIEVPMDAITLENITDSIERKFGSIFHLVLRYKDSEGDLVTIVTQEDVDIAVKDFEISELFLSDDPDAVMSW